MNAPPDIPPQRCLRITGRRAIPRVRLYIPAKVLMIHGLENCLLDDLSQAGASVTLAGHLPRPGASVVLTARDLDAFGAVVWSQGARFGLVFEEHLPLQAVVNLRHFADSWTGNEAARQRRLERGRGPLRPFG